ncbi:MAG: type II methionyl aminopeptidase [Thaumarchaeota archaeon]|jgi:methionyl aminopeptidase|nr:type II methionyl aminopeptidase [Candidatus Terraquivivens yellowstonensis]MCL7395255.1 type II methionyl aminopeptidase [Candidatus Terraquivivens yellowstonensis]MCL7397457.1 type II methionyl aminopeptidase [Candidatus Terraquivivens yellowstonensis]MCL7400432.1 type II methionyl aminopeptidase [Candidatus Terraquivivens yellowstonensis]
MNEEGLDLLIQAGRIAARVKERAYSLVKEGVRLIEICEAVETMIESEGGRSAFPCNVCVDEVAAHYSPLPNDQSTVPPNALVKIDLGVHLDGYIVDTAISVSLSKEKQSLVSTAEEALRAAVKFIRAGTRIGEIGAVIQSTIQKAGFKPIRNLTGHEISRYNLHGGASIPNVAIPDPRRVAKGAVYAIEPFVSFANAAGSVVNADLSTIFMLDIKKVPVAKLKPDEKALVEYIAENFKGLPYSPRWLRGSKIPEILSVHERLVKTGRIHKYPVLVEKTRQPVAQAECTVYVEEDGCKVLT